MKTIEIPIENINNNNLYICKNSDEINYGEYFYDENNNKIVQYEMDDTSSELFNSQKEKLVIIASTDKNLSYVYKIDKDTVLKLLELKEKNINSIICFDIYDINIEGFYKPFNSCSNFHKKVLTFKELKEPTFSKEQIFKFFMNLRDYEIAKQKLLKQFNINCENNNLITKLNLSNLKEINNLDCSKNKLIKQ